MRAGGFAEQRVIELINRRFVPYYFQVREGGCASNAQASAFVGQKTRNPWAFLAAFSPEGTLLGETALYADKEQVFDFLRSLTEKYPSYSRMSESEQKLSREAQRLEASPDTCFAAGQMFQELGDFVRARQAYERILAAKAEKKIAAQSALELARIARYQREWDRARERIDTAESLLEQPALGFSERIVLERAHIDLAHGQYRKAQEQLESAIAAWPKSQWLGEMRYYAGVACFFLGQFDRAKYHWVWVCENIPDDRLYQRCYFSATFEKNPYPNPELGRHDMDMRMNPSGNYAPAKTIAAYREAREVYERVKSQR